MDNKNENYAVYNQMEIAYKEKYSIFKQRVFSTVINRLYNAKITPNQISFLGFVTALLFYIILLLLKSPATALAVFFVYVIADNLDGSLAEKYGIRPEGQFIDNFFDMTSLMVIMLGIGHVSSINVFYVLGFVFLYWFIIFCGSICNLNGFKVLILRLRIFPFIVFILQTLLNRSLMSFSLLMKILIMLELISAVTIFRALILYRKQLKFPPVIKNTIAEIRVLGMFSLTAVAVSIFLYFLFA
jgi:phosphatidylglycerophosphate synthase